MSSFICKGCDTAHSIYNRDDLSLSGIVNYFDMDEIAKVNEKTSLDKVKYVYYYFDKAHLPIIKNNCNAAANPREYCEDCIRETIDNTFNTKDPHYADGIYLSTHKNLKGAADKVRYAHGEQVSIREFRIKFKIISHQYIKKITSTGGVLKSIENKWHNSLFFLNTQDRRVAEFKGIEEYKDGKWVLI